jgi:hypothetical protein
MKKGEDSCRQRNNKKRELKMKMKMKVFSCRQAKESETTEEEETAVDSETSRRDS